MLTSHRHLSVSKREHSDIEIVLMYCPHCCSNDLRPTSRPALEMI